MNKSSNETFTCEACGQLNLKDKSDEDAAKEYEATFQRPFDKDDIAIVCDDCYNTLMRDYM